ncbi:hypothetical protein Asal01_01596 [Fodinibius salicampi]
MVNPLAITFFLKSIYDYDSHSFISFYCMYYNSVFFPTKGMEK